LGGCRWLSCTVGKYSQNRRKQAISGPEPKLTLHHIPPGRGSRVFIHRSLHISGHGNSVHGPISLQGGALEFLSTDPCTFSDMETPSVGPYPFREGHQSFYPQIPAHFQTWKLCPWACIPPGRGTGVFIHGSLHISGHGNSICGPMSLQGGALEFLSTDPCTFLDMETMTKYSVWQVD